MTRDTSDNRPATASVEEWLTPRRFACVLALLIVATFPGILFGRATFVVRDFGMFSYPVAYFQKQCFWQGELPLWNPYNHCGVPFLAQWNTLALYPPALIYLLLPLTWSLPFFCLVHVFWGGMGMYFLADKWTANRLAAAVAGIIFSFNGLSLNFLMWPSHIATFSWLPWVLWLAQRGWLEGGRVLVLAILAGAAQMLAGGPETIAATWLVLLVLACSDFMSRKDHRAEIACRFPLMGLLVAALCAVQLLPFLELLARSQRDSGYDKSTHDWSMPYWGWLNFLVPLFRENPTAQGVFMQNGQYWTSSYYAGIGTILLLAVAIFRVRNRRVWMPGALVLLALILAFGDGTLLYQGLRLVCPGIGFVRYPIKFVILALALAPLLAAIGLDCLMRRKRLDRFEHGVVVSMLLLVVLAIIVEAKSSLAADTWKATSQSAFSRAVFLLITVFAIGLFLRSGGRRRVSMGCLLLALCWLDLVTHAPTQNPGATPSIYSPGWVRSQFKLDQVPELGKSRAMVAPAALDVLKYNPLPNVDEAYLRNRLALRVNCNLLDNVPQMDGFYSLVPRESFKATLLPYDHPENQVPRLLDLLGIAEVTVLGTNLDWKPRPTAMNFITIGQQPVFANDRTAINALTNATSDFTRFVYLPPEAKEPVLAKMSPDAKVFDASFRNTQVRFQTKSSVAAVAVISQTYFPAWKAYIDGQATPIWRADYAFQAVEVPAGAHTVLLAYEDAKLKIGGVISALGLVACIGMWAAAPHFAKRAAKQSGSDQQTNAASATA